MSSINEIWIVDDNEVNNFICESLINVALPQLPVKCFIDAESALKELKTTGYSPKRIILLDVNMPTMNGWQFLDVFKENSDHIQIQNTIYMLTSSIAKYDLEMAENYPFVKGFISKPLTKELILKIYAELGQQ